MHNVDKERIVLGSGRLYTLEFTGTMPPHELIETEENQIGLIQGGATLEYKPEFYTAEDDLGLAKKQLLTKEEVTLKSGIMTWCGRTLEKLCSTARMSEDSKSRTVRIGGVGNYDGKQYLVRFWHQDKQDGDIRVTIVGNNQSGFSIGFAKDKETVIDAEFKAIPHDNEGTLIVYEEERKGAGGVVTGV